MRTPSRPTKSVVRDAAGMVEDFGRFMVKRVGSGYYAQARVETNDITVAGYMRRVFGGNISARKVTDHRPRYTHFVSGEKAVIMADMVRPYLRDERLIENLDRMVGVHNARLVTKGNPAWTYSDEGYIISTAI